MAAEKRVAGVFGGEEAGVGRAAKGTAADEGRERSDGYAGQVGVGDGGAVGGGGGVEAEGLLDERGEIGVAAVEEEVGERLILDFEFEALGAVGE